MNDHGVVVGEMVSTDGMPHAYVWSPTGGFTDLTPDPHSIVSRATSINNLDQVIGVTTPDNGPCYPFLYESDTYYNMTTLITDLDAQWDWLYPKVITDTGEIYGYGSYAGNNRAFLLTPLATTASPVPEPATLALLTLGTLALLRRR